MPLTNESFDNFGTIFGCKQIYDALIDEKSKFILTNRWLYSITDEYKYIDNIVGSMPELKIMRICLGGG